jgi:inositol oxygenase
MLLLTLARRLAHPELDWLHLAGLIHGLGKLLAHQRFGCQPQWAVCGETFPVGCRFDDHIPFGQYFSVNPDRRRRIYNTQSGIYTPGCGLSSVYMRWSGCEYLHMVLVLNRQVVDLPDAALFMIRHHKFASLTRPGSPYASLLNEDEQELLPLLKEFQEVGARSPCCCCRCPPPPRSCPATAPHACCCPAAPNVLAKPVRPAALPFAWLPAHLNHSRLIPASPVVPAGHCLPSPGAARGRAAGPGPPRLLQGPNLQVHWQQQHPVVVEGGQGEEGKWGLASSVLQPWPRGGGRAHGGGGAQLY